MRACTQQPKAKRKADAGSLVCYPVGHNTPKRTRVATADTPNSVASCGISVQDLEDNAYRLCGDLNPYIKHQKSVKRFEGNNTQKCKVCGLRSAHHCELCAIRYKEQYGKEAIFPVHFTNPNEILKVPCFTQHHNVMFLGMARNDFRLVNKRKKDMELPDTPEQERHGQEMYQLHQTAISSSSTSTNSSTPARRSINSTITANRPNNSPTRLAVDGDGNTTQADTDRIV